VFTVQILKKKKYLVPFFNKIHPRCVLENKITVKSSSTQQKYFIPASIHNMFQPDRPPSG
jgi:hypothetical protein